MNNVMVGLYLFTDLKNIIVIVANVLEVKDLESHYGVINSDVTPT